MGGGGTHPSRRLGDERGASTADPDVCNQSRERTSDPSRDRGRKDSPRAEKLSFVVAVRRNRRSPAPLWHGGVVKLDAPRSSKASWDVLRFILANILPTCSTSLT